MGAEEDRLGQVRPTRVARTDISEKRRKGADMTEKIDIEQVRAAVRRKLAEDGDSFWNALCAEVLAAAVSVAAACSRRRRP